MDHAVNMKDLPVRYKKIDLNDCLNAALSC